MTAAVLVAADEPGQPFLSPDDLASIKPLWTEAVDRHLMPIVAGVWDDSAGTVHAEMLDATDVDFPFPSVGSAAAEAYLAQARNVYDMVGDDLWQAARNEMLEGFRLGESVDQIAARLRATAGLTARNAVLVARSTVIEASNAGSVATARASGLEMRKEWIATNDPRTRPTHRRADGQVVDLNAQFTVGGFDADFPADPGLPPQEKFRCRCTTGFLLADAVAKDARRQADPEPLPNTSGNAPDTTPPLAQTAPAADTPAARRAARRERQKAIDAADPVADLAAEVDQLGWLRRGQPFDDDAVKIFGQRIQLAVDAGVPDADLAALRAAVQARDMVRVQAEARRLAQTRGLTGVENAGDRVPFDEARHQALVDGTDFADGELVDVHRQGHVLQHGDEAIQLDRAQVRAIAPDVPDAGDFDARAGRALKGDPALDATPGQLSKTDLKVDATTGWSRAELRQRFDDLKEYQGASYESINGWLRGTLKQKFTPAQLDAARIDALARIARLDSIYDHARLVDDVEVWRGMDTGRHVFGDRLAHDLGGFEWLEDAYVSTSARRSMAQSFAADFNGGDPGVLMRLLVPKGTGGVHLQGGEAELLLQRGLRLRVVKDHGVSHTDQGSPYRLLDVEVLPVRVAEKAAAKVARPLTLREQVKARNVASRETLSGGRNARTELVTFEDGTEAVFKSARPVEGLPARLQQDAEELAALTLRAFGIRAPNVYRASARQVYMDRLDGTVAARLPRDARGRPTGGHFESDDGRVMGLVDALTDNYDRNSGNWLLGSDGSLAGIDHGFAFQWRLRAPGEAPFMDTNPFWTFLSRPYPDLGKWASNDLSPADIATARQILVSLRPDYVRLGHVDWHDKALERLDAIGDHAAGVRDRLGTAVADRVDALTDRLSSLQDLLNGGETEDPDTGEQVEELIAQTEAALAVLRGAPKTRMRRKT